jgi:hypothetical protein
MNAREQRRLNLQGSRDSGFARSYLFHSYLSALLAAVENGDSERRAAEHELLVELFTSVNTRLVIAEGNRPAVKRVRAGVAPLRTAKTLHTCTTCGRIIWPGEQYRRGASLNLDEGKVRTQKLCRRCMEGDDETPPLTLDLFVVYREPAE